MWRESVRMCESWQPCVNQYLHSITVINVSVSHVTRRITSTVPLQIYSQVTLRSPLARTSRGQTVTVDHRLRSSRGQLQTGSNSAVCNAPEEPVSSIRAGDERRTAQKHTYLHLLLHTEPLTTQLLLIELTERTNT